MIITIKHLLFAFLLFCITFSTLGAQTARGTVFVDENENTIRDSGEKGLAGVLVSNGRQVVQTDEDGMWDLPVDADTGIFLIQPAGYRVPCNSSNLPQYYYLHKPNGSPALAKKGVAPGGRLPESIDFALRPEKPPDRFSMLLFGDPQARGLREVNFISKDVVAECIGTDAAFGVSLGDMVADDPDLFDEISQSIGQIGIPWYNTFGNHDSNGDASEDLYRDETFERFFGPSTFAFEYGRVAFIVLRNVHFEPGGRYGAWLTDAQIDFIKNYLTFVPDDKLVMLMMHVPIFRIKNRDALYEILKDRSHLFSASGHVHEMSHLFMDETMGWPGQKPHHHFINATVSGSWWCGLQDELGIPHATMNDGAPNGYAIIAFEGNQYKITFKAARRPADYQMNIYLPDDLETAAIDTTRIQVNVFAGSQRSKVEARFGKNGEWMELIPEVTADPAGLRMYELGPYLDQKVNGQTLDEIFGWKMDKPGNSRHIWEGPVPKTLTTGTHRVTVRTTDMFGQTWTAHHILRIR